jgi:hypothetical protein
MLNKNEPVLKPQHVNASRQTVLETLTHNTPLSFATQNHSSAAHLKVASVNVSDQYGEILYGVLPEPKSRDYKAFVSNPPVRMKVLSKHTTEMSRNILKKLANTADDAT